MIRKFNFGDLYEGLSVFDRMFTIPSFTINGQFVDTDKFTISPKPEYLEEQIKSKEQEIAENEIAMQSSQKYYESVKQRLLVEKESLISQRKKNDNNPC